MRKTRCKATVGVERLEGRQLQTVMVMRPPSIPVSPPVIGHFPTNPQTPPHINPFILSSTGGHTS
jgi:hypothetical protein